LRPTFGPAGGFPLQPARQQPGREQRAKALGAAADMRLHELVPPALGSRAGVFGALAPGS
jgi:hypothetical protein